MRNNNRPKLTPKDHFHSFIASGKKKLIPAKEEVVKSCDEWLMLKTDIEHFIRKVNSYKSEKRQFFTALSKRDPWPFHYVIAMLLAALSFDLIATKPFVEGATHFLKSDLIPEVIFATLPFLFPGLVVIIYLSLMVWLRYESWEWEREEEQNIQNHEGMTTITQEYEPTPMSPSYKLAWVFKWSPILFFAILYYSYTLLGISTAADVALTVFIFVVATVVHLALLLNAESIINSLENKFAKIKWSQFERRKIKFMKLKSKRESAIKYASSRFYGIYNDHRRDIKEYDTTKNLEDYFPELIFNEYETNLVYTFTGIRLKGESFPYHNLNYEPFQGWKDPWSSAHEKSDINDHVEHNFSTEPTESRDSPSTFYPNSTNIISEE